MNYKLSLISHTMHHVTISPSNVVLQFISTLLLRFSAVSAIPEGNLWPFDKRTFKGRMCEDGLMNYK